jgi:hypothetical protein
MENRACTLPAKVIEAKYPGFGKAFRSAAAGRRDMTAWGEREGIMHSGETLTPHIPDQPVWPHPATARG